MIIKNFELNKTNISKYNIYLFYGKNEGFQNEIIHNYFTKDFKDSIYKYDESELLSNKDVAIGEMMTRSFFDIERIFIISRVSDKIIKFIEEIIEKQINGIKIILKSKSLDKRSKLRNFFEKDKLLVTIPFYEEKSKDLFPFISKFLNNNKIKLSMESINLLVNRTGGERQNLSNELSKILSYSQTNKNIDFETIKKLTNLSENYEVSELVDQYLSKKTTNVVKILNENNYNNEDCILIVRMVLIKSKRLLSILEKYKDNNNLDEIISNTKPPIFWKEKERVKFQAKSWNLTDLKNKIYELNEIEKLIKTNSRNSLNIISDFVVNY